MHVPHYMLFTQNVNIYYMGNLSREATEEELRQEFTAFGQVTSVSVIKGKYSG